MSNLSKIWPFSEAEWLTTALLVSGPLWLWRLTGLLTLASDTSCSEFGVTEEALVMKVNFSSQFGSSTSVVETFSFPFMFSYSTGLSFTCSGFVKLVHKQPYSDIPKKWSLIRCIFLNVIRRLLTLLWNRVWKISSSSWLSSRPSSSLSYYANREYKNKCYVMGSNKGYAMAVTYQRCLCFQVFDVKIPSAHSSLVFTLTLTKQVFQCPTLH